jgi:hypothetical protein
MNLENALACAVAVGIGVNATFAYSTGSALMRRGAPFVPSAQRKIDAIFGTKNGVLFGPRGVLRSIPLQQRQRMHAVDLGSGGGALVRAAVRQGGFGRSTGYELNPALVAYSRMASAFSPQESFHLQCMWTSDVSDADLVCVYGVQSIMGDLETKLKAEMPAGSLVISNMFPFPLADPSKLAEERTCERQTLALIDRRFVSAGLRSLSLDDSSEIFVYRIERHSRMRNPESRMTSTVNFCG